MFLCRAASREYSSAILALLAAAWAFGSLILVSFEPRGRLVYFGAVALSAPAISYSMLGHGLLIMGGFLHALSVGVYVLAVHFWFQSFRESRRPPVICTSAT
jgi:hypothetical protein